MSILNRVLKLFKRSPLPGGQAAEPEQPPQQPIPVPAPAATVTPKPTLKERVWKKAKKSLGTLLWDSYKDGQCVLGKNAYKRATRRPRPRLGSAAPPPEPVCVSPWGNGFRHHRWQGTTCARCSATREVRQSEAA